MLLHFLYSSTSSIISVTSHSRASQIFTSMSVVMFSPLPNVLKVTMDVLLSEFLEHNKAAVGAELSAILDDCSEYEKRVIIDGARSLKQVLREARHLIRRR